MSQPRSPEYPSPRTHNDDGPSPEMAPTEARQGVKGHNVRVVLTLGIVGVVVGLAIAYFFFFPTPG
jgi:hypothetical protein